MRDVIFISKRPAQDCQNKEFLAKEFYEFYHFQSPIRIDDTEGLESLLIDDGLPFDRIRMGGDTYWE